jgi:capsular polysaccharide export protein
VAWASREPDGFETRCRAQGAPLVRLEDGFLRSVGLGANLELPSSLVLDRSGIYYDPAGPSDIETLLQTADVSDELRGRAADLRHLITASRVSKYNVGSADLGDVMAGAEGRLKVLVPAQVANDASVVRGGGRIGDNLGLLKAAREARPDAFIVFKPHPDVEAGIRPGAVPEGDVLSYADAIAAKASIAHLLDEVDEVHTLTSLAGFEALLKGKRVATYGLPFYAGWGITEDAERCPRRTRRLTLDELVAGALILYPRYVHRPSGWPCEPEDVVRQLAISLRQTDATGLLRRRRTDTLLRQHLGRPLG